MLYGVGLGPGDRKLLTFRAVEVIQEADEVIVPGKIAYSIIKDISNPRIVEFPMGGSEEVTKKIGREIAGREDERIAFCCLGDPVFYSTFHRVVSEVLRNNPGIKVEIVPGIPSFSCALGKTLTFVNGSMLLTTQDFSDVDVAVVLKAKRSEKIEMELRRKGFDRFLLVERMFMDGESVYSTIPERSDYFSILIGLKSEVRDL